MLSVEKNATNYANQGNSDFHRETCFFFEVIKRIIVVIV